jgi:hypothetical protein
MIETLGMMIVVQGTTGSRCVASERRGSRAGAAAAVSKALDDAHDAPTIGTGRNLGPGMEDRIQGRRLDIVWRFPLMIEKGAAKGELGGAMVVGHEAKMADAMEAVGQRVKQEAADELVRLEPHDFCRAVLAVVLP